MSLQYLLSEKLKITHSKVVLNDKHHSQFSKQCDHNQSEEDKCDNISVIAQIPHETNQRITHHNSTFQVSIFISEPPIFGMHEKFILGLKDLNLCIENVNMRNIKNAI